MVGLLVLVVGPSGAGKDTLISAARRELADDGRYVFPRRLVTRKADPRLEDHETLTWDAFRSGPFALQWEAHGLGYALPLSIEADLASDRTVVTNVSRRVLPAAADRFRCAVLSVTADADVRASRLAARGRESPGAVAARLAREATALPAEGMPVVTIDNSGDLARAVAAFVAALRALSR